MKRALRKELVREAKSIGVVSAKNGEGNTTVVIALSTYLSGVKGEKTALVEVGTPHDFENIKMVYMGQNPSQNKITFTLFGTDYYHVDKTADIGLIYGKNYENVILDFGTDYERNVKELMRCSMKIVLGTVNMWRYDDYRQLCEYLKKISGWDTWLHIIGGDRDDMREHVRKYGITAVEKIFIDNPYVIDNHQMEFFQKIV